MNLPTTPKQVRAFLGLVGYYRKFIKGFAKVAKPLTLLTRQQVKFEWTPDHQAAFEHLKNAIVQAPILNYPNPNKTYIVYTDALDDACGAQLSQNHNGTEFPIAFLSHTFSETQQKWSTTKQEAFGVYYTITKWNYYLQGANIIVRNDHKPLARFLNGKNANNKVTRKFTWPMPKVEDIFSKLNGATYFSTLDLCTGYHHIPLDKSSIPKTAFNSPFRKYEYIKVPFGLTQAPAYFEELMTGLLKDFPFAIAYLDDIIIFSKTLQEHLSHIHMVFEKLQTANLSMKNSKCNFFSKEIKYLGHILSATGI